MGDRVQRRLNAYCKGLLEVHDDRVEFLHRTVADYLMIPDVAERLTMQSPEWFHPKLSLAKMHLSYVKISPLIIPHRHNPGHYDGSLLDEHVRAILTLASLYDTDKSIVRDKFRLLLCDMESALNTEPFWKPTPCISPRASRSLYFRERLLQSSLPNYLEKMLSTYTEYLGNFDWPPLAIVMEEGCPSQHAETIKLLFGHGQKPNEEFTILVSDKIKRIKTPWTSLLSLLVHQTRDGLTSRLLPYFGPCLRVGIFDLYLDYGADPNASVYRREGQPHTTAWIDILFACFEIEKKDEERYLRVLGQLLQRNASVDGVIPMGPESAAYMESASETILKRFFQLAQVLEYSPSFIIRVSEHLVRRARRARWSLKTVWPEVRLAFGDTKTKHLKAIYRAEKPTNFIWGSICVPLFKVGRKRPNDKSVI